MMKHILTGVVLLFTGCVASAQQPVAPPAVQSMPRLSVAAQKTVNSALEQSALQWIEKADSKEERALHDKAALEFSRLLDVLTTQIDVATAQHLAAYEGQDINAKLITIAWYRKLHPKWYAEIRDAYIFPPPADPTLHDTFHPNIDGKHEHDRYRLAWEYWLLSPSYQGSLNDDRKPILCILGKIKNHSSILTLTTMFQQTLKAGIPEADGRVGTLQEVTLDTLIGYPDAEGWHAMLECVAAYEERYSKAPPENKYTTNVPDYVQEQLTKLENPGLIVKWRQAIKAYPRNGLSKRQIEIMDATIKALL